ncbi:putative f-box domain protein [Favolaschia claudopus]|uniref:F-box domain protein n=1 Tax=Favolaschia claudopus TaxID=2862362 RepID=A0AAW0CZY0_9AGAR
MSTAQDTVFSSPELLELILSHLSMRDLLCTAPLVSKTWQATTKSPSLQRILFFESDPSADPSDPAQNPLLAELFSPFLARLERQNPSVYHWPGRTASIKAMPWANNPDAFRRVGASWRRMLVTQPSVRTLTVKYVTSGSAGSSSLWARMSDLSLRMGYLYDLVLPLTQDGVWFWVDWHDAGPGREYNSEITLHLWKPISWVVDDDEHVQRDRTFESEEMQIVEIPFSPKCSSG